MNSCSHLPRGQSTRIVLQSQFHCRTAHHPGKVLGTTILWSKNWSKKRSNLVLWHMCQGHPRIQIQVQTHGSGKTWCGDYRTYRASGGRQQHLNVTANTVLPNHMLLPRINDVIPCTPTDMSQNQLLQLTLDVSKAHRRILIHPDDQGLLCFHVGDQL